MAQAFTTGAYVTSGQDDSRKTLIAVQDKEGKAMFNNCFLTNFESNRTSDASIMKNLSHGFMFTTFGSSPITVTVSGIYSGEGTYADSDDSNGYNELDPEALFDLHNISGQDRKLITITTMYSSKDSKCKPIQCVGYMTAFRKNPMSDDKIQAYGFTITLIVAIKQS